MKFMQLRKKREGKIRAWLELARLPELFGVPGDFLAGAALSSVLTGFYPSLFLLAAGSLGIIFLYAAGRIYKDICDQSGDHFHKPDRPLPSRRLSSGEAMAGTGLCLLAAFILLALCGRRPLICALVLAVLTGAYDSFLKNRIESSVVAMGLCRGLVFLSGCSLSPWHPGVFPAFLAVSLYVGLLFWIADGEERHQIPDKYVFYPAGILAGGWVFTFPFLIFSQDFSGRSAGYSVLALLIACGLVVFAAVQIYNRSVSTSDMKTYIRNLFLALMPWQACWIFLAAAHRPVAMNAAAVCLLLIFPPMSWGLYRIFAGK